MFLEDKLTHDERVRLECIEQAIVSFSMKSCTEDTIIIRAKEFEKYILEGDNG